MGYLSLTGQIAPIHTDGTPRNDDRILIGDELIVQVTKEAVKTKPPTVSCAIELPGRYAVLTRKNGIVTSVSKRSKMRTSGKTYAAFCRNMPVNLMGLWREPTVPPVRK